MILDRIPYQPLQWLFPLTIALHNLEESIFMPRFWRGHGLLTAYLPCTTREVFLRRTQNFSS